jgi:hypothetical protein
MNWAIWVGILFGAISAGFLYYGTHLNTQQSSQDTAETFRTELAKNFDLTVPVPPQT